MNNSFQFNINHLGSVVFKINVLGQPQIHLFNQYIRSVFRVIEIKWAHEFDIIIFNFIAECFDCFFLTTIDR